MVLFPNPAIARQVTHELSSRVLADSGWHIYTQMEHLLRQRTASVRGAPFNSPGDAVADNYRPGMLPRTDALVNRAMSIGIGVADPNLGSTFGVTVLDGPDAVRARRRLPQGRRQVSRRAGLGQLARSRQARLEQLTPHHD